MSDDAFKKAGAITNLNQCNFAIRFGNDPTDTVNKNLSCAEMYVPYYLQGNYIENSLAVLGCKELSSKREREPDPGTPFYIHDRGDENYFISGHALDLLAKAGVEKLAPLKPRENAINKLAQR